MLDGAVSLLEAGTVSSGVEAVVARALCKQPEGRFGNTLGPAPQTSNRLAVLQQKSTYYEFDSGRASRVRT